MTEITDEYMRSQLPLAKAYTVVLLKAAEKYADEGSGPIIWEHGRRNFALRAEGKLAIVCPVTDDTELCGVGLFTTTPDETRQIMDGDPGVQAGVFTYEIHPVRSFPGDSLP